jgi:hypothetical protein
MVQNCAQTKRLSSKTLLNFPAKILLEGVMKVGLFKTLEFQTYNGKEKMKYKNVNIAVT